MTISAAQILFNRVNMKTDCAKIQQLIIQLKDHQQEFESGLASLPEERYGALLEMANLAKLREKISALVNALKLELDPTMNWKKYGNGEQLVHYWDKKLTDWRPHSQGVVIYDYDNKRLLLNGQTVIENGFDEYQDFCNSMRERLKPIHHGSSNSDCYFDGKLIYQGNYGGTQWSLNNRGLIKTESVWSNGEITLYGAKGQELLYDGKFNSWHPYLDGIIVQTGNELHYYDHWPVEGN